MTAVRRARTLRREAVSSSRISLGEPATRIGKPRHLGILAIARRIHGQRDVPADHPELHALLISGRQVLIERLAHGAERGAAIRGEFGEVLSHGGSCHGGDDTCCGSGRELYGGGL